MVPPNENNVRDAIRKFDEESVIIERALQELFRQYPTNDSEAHVLLKVVALNGLYRTNILAVEDVARHIYQQAEEVDSALKTGSPGIVDKIAKVTIAATQKERHNWSFATKYCSWHNPGAYPIWDSRVCRYLTSLKDTPFAQPDRWERYAEFVALMASFREHYRLDSFGFKDIDKFLWIYGAQDPPHTAATAGAQI